MTTQNAYDPDQQKTVFNLFITILCYRIQVFCFNTKRVKTKYVNKEKYPRK